MAIPVIVEYYARESEAEQLAQLLASHWSILRDEGFTTDQPAFLMRDTDDPNLFIEVFEWKDEEGPDAAWENPTISELWHDIQSHCDEDIVPIYYETISAVVPGGG